MQVVHYISSFSLYVVSFYDNGPFLCLIIHILLRNLDDALCPYVSFSLLTQTLCQVEHLQPSSTGVVEYRSTREGLATIVRSQGWRQLFAGLSINYIKVPS